MRKKQLVSGIYNAMQSNITVCVTEDVIKMHHQESVSLIFPIDIKISFKICFRKIRRVEEKLGKGDSILLNHETINFPLCFFFLVKLWED